MRTLRLIPIAVLLWLTSAFPQSNKIVFGPLEGDDAGVLTVRNGEDIGIELWVRTDPQNPVPIVGVAHGLMSEDAIIAERNGMDIEPEYDMPYWGQVWVDGPYVHDPNHPFPIPIGYTAEIQGALYTVFQVPYPGSHPLDTGGEWDYYGTFLMASNNDVPIEDTYYPFSMGWYPYDSLGTRWWFHAPPGGTVVPEQDYCGLYFVENTEPEFTICPDSTHHVNPHQPICLEIAGIDADTLDDLHISLVSGPGMFTEEVGGPGGLASGLWCWDDPIIGDYDIVLELNDNAGGVAYCEFELTVEDIALEIETTVGFPGGTVVVPIRLHTWPLRVGGLRLLIGWNKTNITLTGVNPKSRLDFGHEYFHYYEPDLHNPQPDVRGAVRITWISDIDDGVPHRPAWAGSERIIDLIFEVNPAIPWDITVPIIFFSEDDSDNTVADSTGEIWHLPTLIDGSIELVDPMAFRKGDVNMNGYFFEIGDFLLVVQRLIHGYIIWAENGRRDDALQEAAADLNNSGGVDIGDLIMFMNIMNGIVDPPYKLEPDPMVARIGVSEFQKDAIVLFIETSVDVGAVLVRISHPGFVFGEPSAGNGMEIFHHDFGDLLSVLVCSREAKRIPAGVSEFLSIPVISDNGGVISFEEVSAADSHGRILEIVTSADTSPPTAIALHQNYPNPFNASTIIRYALPEEGYVSIEIFDILGRKVETLISEYQPAGSHAVIWNASAYPSGIYLYRIGAKEHTEWKRCLLLK